MTEATEVKETKAVIPSAAEATPSLQPRQSLLDRFLARLRGIRNAAPFASPEVPSDQSQSSVKEPQPTGSGPKS